MYKKKLGSMYFIQKDLSSARIKISPIALNPSLKEKVYLTESDLS